jgi:hypothetical protein
MQPNVFLDLLKKHKQILLNHRYINNDHIVKLLNALPSEFKVEDIGKSVMDESIYSVTIGNGPIKVLMWSQMHGNESTSTKALFDLFKLLSSSNESSDTILNRYTLKIIPILNPDGARLYTRLNANEVDLNRDAQDQTQPESTVLLRLFNDLKPDFCFNLHGQRTIFSAGKVNKPATMSFLAPAQDAETTVTDNRKQAMAVIVAINNALQRIIPNQVGIYDDSFNLNCVGDTFQSKHVPTILFEAGHCDNDYSRETVRLYFGLSIMTALHFIADNSGSVNSYQDYFNIPMNEKLFYDIIIRNAKLATNDNDQDVAIQYQEVLMNNKVDFLPIIEKIGKLEDNFGHKEIDAQSSLVVTANNARLEEANEIDFVLIKNQLFALKPTNS